MKIKILAPILFVILLTVPMINGSAVSYMDYSDLSASDSNTIRLFNYAKNDYFGQVTYPFLDCIAFSTDSNHSYLVFGNISLSEGVYSSSNAIVYKLVRSSVGGISISKTIDSNFALFSSHLLLGNLPTLQSFNGLSDFTFQSEVLVLILLVFLVTGFSMFLNVKRS